MATIVLDRHESFEHFHSQPSQTVLKEGRAQLRIDDSVVDLEPGVAVTIPPNTSHTIVNMGDTVAVVGCVH